MDVSEMKEKRTELVEKASKIKDGAAAADRDLSDDEIDKVESYLDDAEELEDAIEDAEKGDRIEQRLDDARRDLDSDDGCCLALRFGLGLRCFAHHIHSFATYPLIDSPYPACTTINFACSTSRLVLHTITVRTLL